MIVNNFNALSFVGYPFETNTPLVIDTYTVQPLWWPNCKINLKFREMFGNLLLLRGVLVEKGK